MKSQRPITVIYSIWCFYSNEHLTVDLFYCFPGYRGEFWIKDLHLLAFPSRLGWLWNNTRAHSCGLLLKLRGSSFWMQIQTSPSVDLRILTRAVIDATHASAFMSLDCICQFCSSKSPTWRRLLLSICKYKNYAMRDITPLVFSKQSRIYKSNRQYFVCMHRIRWQVTVAHT